jgi:uncharacterized membrane protein
MIRDTLKRTNILTNTSGNIGLSAALVLPLVVLSLGLGVDFGYLTLQKQELQGVADLTAIVAASDLPNLETAARNHFKTNGLSMAIATKNGLINPDGKVIPKDQFAAKNGIATIVTGRYVPDPSLPTGQRFIANATPADAAQVTIEKEGTIHLAAMFSKPPTMSATGTAASTKLASFSVGSRLASLNDGILNQLLGQMLGTTISLKLMDYQALVNADINIQPFLKNVSTRLNLTAASYDDVLKANITMPQLLASMQAVQGVSAAANSALKALETATKLNKKTFTLSQILNIDPKKAISVNAGSNWAMKVSALDIVSTAAALANGNKQISLAAIAGLPGIASASVNLAIGEPPVTTPSQRLGAPGSAVRTAQTRLMIEVNIDGLALLAGLKIKLPIYVEVAYAEAKLADIRCYGGSATNASVSIDAVPGVAEIAIGTVNPTVLSNFSSDARVEQACILDSLLVRIDGIAHVEATNLKPQRLTFSPSEVAANSLKTVSTKDILTSATQTLLNNLDVDIQVLFLTLGSPKLVQAALAQTLGAVTPAIDTLIYNLLLAVGVRVGEADVRVTGVNCLQPVLVQ